MHQVFLSYARADVAHAKKLYTHLKGIPGIKPWIDEIDLIPGVMWRPAIRKAIRDSCCFIALISRQSVTTKGYRHSELRQAVKIMQEFPQNQVFIITTRIDECEPPVDVLKEYTYADLFPDWKGGVTRLRKSLKTAVASARPAQIGAASAKKETDDPYHYRVRLVDLDDSLASLRGVARALNSIQRFAYFTTAKVNPSRAARQVIYGVSRLDIDQLTPAFYQAVAPPSVDHVFCLTKRLLLFKDKGKVYDDYLQAPSEVDERVAFGSVNDLREYTDAARIKYAAGISFRIVCDLASYFIELDFHKERRGCPMDFTVDDLSNVKCLTTRRFCKDCLKKLDVNKGLKAALIKMLEWEPK
jgi:hypothetical protein